MDILLDIQEEYHHIPSEAVEIVADQLDLSRVDVEQTITFYHFLSLKPVGKYAIYLNDSPVAYMHGRADVAQAFEQEAGVTFNNVTDDGLIGLWDTADIGMSDQEPAAIINGMVFTELDPTKVKSIIRGMVDGKEIAEIAEEVADSINSKDHLRTMVKNNIHEVLLPLLIINMEKRLKKPLAKHLYRSLMRLKYLICVGAVAQDSRLALSGNTAAKMLRTRFI